MQYFDKPVREVGLIISAIFKAKKFFGQDILSLAADKKRDKRQMPQMQSQEYSFITWNRRHKKVICWQDRK